MPVMSISGPRGQRNFVILRLLTFETGQPRFGPNLLALIFFICKMALIIFQDPPWYGFPASCYFLVICAQESLKWNMVSATESLCTCSFLPSGNPSLAVPPRPTGTHSPEPGVCFSQDRTGYMVVTDNLQVSMAYHRNLFLLMLPDGCCLS